MTYRKAHMLAYHDDPALKARLIAEMREHRESERLVRGLYYDSHSGKGCAVGCLLKDPLGRHARYESEFGIPAQLAHLEDALFEALPQSEAQKWPERFLEAIPVGADLGFVWPRFAIWLFTDAEHGVARHDSSGACERVAALYRRFADGDKPEQREWEAAANAAAYAAAGAYGPDPVRVANAAYAAAYAVVDAVAAARAAGDAAADPETAAGANAWHHQAETLLILLAQATPTERST